MTTKIYPILLLSVIFLAACGSKNEPANEPKEAESNEVVLDQKVAADNDIVSGRASMQTFTGVVKANGALKVLPQGEASVASPMGANIKRILVKEGQPVRQGQVLAVLSHPDLLDLQSRYLAASSRLTYVSSEYQRQKQLYAQKIGAGKDFQQIASEYRQLQGELRVTARQLSLLGINPASIRKGATVTTIAVKSPISGTVEAVNAQLGQYADPQSALFTIINSSHVYADVLVYENDLAKVRVGAPVTLYSKTIAGKTQGSVTSVGRMFDGQNRAVHVRIAIGSHQGSLVPGAYVTANIGYGGTKRLAVPTDAVATDGGRSYVFLATKKQGKMVFTPLEVKTGQTTNGFIEIVSGLDAQKEVAISGAYVLMSQWKKADAEQ